MINLDLYGVMMVSQGDKSCEVKLDNIKENLVVYTNEGPVFINLDDLIIKLKEQNVEYVQ